VKQNGRTLLIWVALLVVFLALFNLSGSEDRFGVDYETFLADVEAGRVLAVRVHGNEIAPRVEVECIDRVGAKDLVDQLDADAPPTADLERGSSSHRPAHAQQPGRFEVPLYGGPKRVVHQSVLGAIQQHRSSPPLVKLRVRPGAPRRPVARLARAAGRRRRLELASGHSRAERLASIPPRNRVAVA